MIDVRSINLVKNVYIGEIDVQASEMCFVQYLPIRLRYDRWDFPGSVLIPDNLKWTGPVVDRCLKDFEHRHGEWYGYIYLTAKHMFVSSESSMNRPGWHIDGYGTDDINYFWYDKFPTEIANQEFYDLSDDHEASLIQMEEQVDRNCIVTFPDRSLLRLDNTVVHRVAPVTKSDYRTFVKVSFSNDKYNLKGNAHNYLLDYEFNMVERERIRNHPSKE